jgi:hypothetical protein
MNAPETLAAIRMFQRPDLIEAWEIERMMLQATWTYQMLEA